MRLSLRSVTPLLLAVGVATCSDAPSVGPRPSAKPGKGLLSLAPVFSKAAAAVLAQRSLFADVTFDHVRVVLVRPPADTVSDTTIVFAPGSAPQTLELTVDVLNVGEIFDGSIDYTNNGAVVFHGEAKLQSHAPDQPAPPQQQIVLQYVGVGANTARLTIVPSAITIVAPGSRTFTAIAEDAAGGQINGVPVTWSSSDPTVATIGPSTGVLATTGKRGSATITARTPTGVTGNATVTVTLPATGIVLVSGGGQTGKAGSALPQPAVIRVVASDGIGVSVASVNFAAPAGGSVGASTVTTDLNGQASTTLTLGGTAGPQSFVAATGVFSVSIPATATPADPSVVLALSGSGQQDTVRKALKQPFVAKVTDRFGNVVPGVAVTWARTAGAGTLANTSTVTGPEGTTSVGYTLGPTAGTETVTATAAGVTGSATFTATALSAGPANIVAVSGSGQTGRVSQPLGAPFVVRAIDETGAPVAGVIVSWTAANGNLSPTTTTNAQGEASNTMTLGTVVGTASATATITTPAGARSVSFSATVQPGVVARLAFRTLPSSVAVGSPITPAVQIELQDAAGNRTAAANAVTIALGTNPGQATLGGTLTRNASGGVATFDDLTLSQVGTGYTLVASSAAVPSVTSAPFNVTAQIAASMALVDGQTFQPLPAESPAVVMTAGTAPVNPPAIKVSDARGQGVAGVTVTFSVSRNESALFGGTAATNAQGIITFAALLVSPANLTMAGNYILTATLANVAGSPINLPVTVVPAAPAALKFGTPFPTGAAAGTPLTPPIVVAVVDQYSNIVTTAGDSITLGISQGTGTPGAVLGGTFGKRASNGVATFDNVTIDRAGSGYVLTAAAAGLTSAISPAFTIAAGAGSAFVVTALPASPPPGGTSTVSAQLVDANNNPLATPTPRTVTWTVSGSGSVSPLTSTTNAQGVATTTYTAPITGVTPGAVTARGDATINNATGSVTITPLVPSSVAAVTPVLAATVDASQPWPTASYPSVRVTSATSVPVPNVPVTFTASGGGCFTPGEAPSVVTTDANGVAKLDAATYTIDRSAEGSCLVTAVANGTLTAFVSVVVAPATTIKTWIGATSTNWSTASNWLNDAIPSASDSVFVPGWVLKRPTLTQAVTIGGLRPERSGASFVDVANSVLTINGDLVTFGELAIMTSGSGSVVFNKAGAGILSGVINAPVSIGSTTCATSYTVTAPGATGTTGLATGPLTVNCPLTIPQAVVTVSGPATIQNTGTLTMNNSASTLLTTGDITFDGADELLTNGVILVGGNMTIRGTHGPNAFVSEALATQTFQNAGAHTITVGLKAAPTFGQLIVSGQQGANTVTVAGDITADFISVTDAASLVAPGTIITRQASTVGTGNLAGVNTLIVTGTTFPNIPSAAPARTVVTNDSVGTANNATLGGSLEVQGTLHVAGDLSITIAGNLSVTGIKGEIVMQADAAHLTVKGDVTFAGRAASRLTNGTLEVGGNFTQSSAVSSQSFAASGGHTTIFNSTTGVKTVTFASANAEGSTFGAVEVASGGIKVTSGLVTTGFFRNRAQVDFLGSGTSTQIGGTMFFQDPSTTVVRDGTTVAILGAAQFPPTWTGITVTIEPNGSMFAELGCSPVGGIFPAGATFCRVGF